MILKNIYFFCFWCSKSEVFISLLGVHRRIGKWDLKNTHFWTKYFFSLKQSFLRFRIQNSCIVSYSCLIPRMFSGLLILNYKLCQYLKCSWEWLHEPLSCQNLNFYPQPPHDNGMWWHIFLTPEMEVGLIGWPIQPFRWSGELKIELETLSLRGRWRVDEEDTRSDVWPQMHRQVNTNAQFLKILQETLYCFQLWILANHPFFQIQFSSTADKDYHSTVYRKRSSRSLYASLVIVPKVYAVVQRMGSKCSSLYIKRPSLRVAYIIL